MRQRQLRDRLMTAALGRADSTRVAIAAPKRRAVTASGYNRSATPR
jgi:hypothetical protein